MKKSRRFTVVVLSVAVLLLASGVGLYLFLPSQLESRAEQVLVDRARIAAENIATYSELGLVRRDSSSVVRATQLAMETEDLVYAVVVGERGQVIASATDDITARADWPTFVDSLSALDLEEVSSAVVMDDWLAATVHVGLSKDTMRAALKEDVAFIAWFAGFLVLLALGAGFGAIQMERLRTTVEEWQQRHKSVRLHAGSLYSSVREHRENERFLKESESKYKSLFESTMASAMSDLEELNRHLEKRKADLEHEVGVRKKAEVALRRYTQRLQLLNAVERSLLEGNAVSESARLALQIAIDLVPAVRLCLVESDARKGTAALLGLESKVETSHRAGQTIPFSSVRTEKEVLHVGDLEDKEDLTQTEKVQLAEGVRSYVEVPMVVQDEIVGVLRMEGSEPRAFSDEHFSIARDIADLLAIGIHRARLDTERELYEQELVEARDRAEDMARLKTAFLTNMSHEIRTPISGIMGFSQVLHEEVPDALQEFTGLIRESAHRLLNTINSVLELARLESGKAGMDLVRMDLNEEAQQVLTRLMPLAERKGLDVRFTAPERPTWSVLDRACVERIVTNVVDNAIKFTDGGGIRVTVTQEQDRAAVIIRDTGVGMSPEFIPQLFDEFRQEQMEADREHEGSGLGLAIAKKLMDRLGGRITVESEKGVGTTVTLDFELDGASSEQEAPSVLLVSESQDAAHLLAEAVKPNFHITGVTSLGEAVARTPREQIEAVIIDVNCGTPAQVEEAAAQLARILGRERVMAIATQIIPRDTESLLKAGFGRFVSQPFSGSCLADALGEALSGGSRPGTESHTSRGDRPARRPSAQPRKRRAGTDLTWGSEAGW